MMMFALLLSCASVRANSPCSQAAGVDDGGESLLPTTLYRALWRARFGEPLPWDETWGDSYRPSEFIRIAERAIRQCGSGAVLLDAECGEPPCIALVRYTTGQPLLPEFTQCEPWTTAYGSTVTLATTTRTCTGGDTAIAAVAPFVSASLVAKVQARAQFVIDSWVCPP